MRAPDRRRRPAVTVLAILLIAWEPTAFAFYASSLVDRLIDRGLVAVALLVLKLAVVGMGIAAGRALWSMRPGAIRFAQITSYRGAARDESLARSPCRKRMECATRFLRAFATATVIAAGSRSIASTGASRTG